MNPLHFTTCLAPAPPLQCTLTAVQLPDMSLLRRPAAIQSMHQHTSSYIPRATNTRSCLTCRSWPHCPAAIQPMHQQPLRQPTRTAARHVAPGRAAQLPFNQCISMQPLRQPTCAAAGHVAPGRAAQLPFNQCISMQPLRQPTRAAA